MQLETRSFTTVYKGKSNVLNNEVAVSNKPYEPLNIPLGVVFKKFLATWDTGATNTVITKRVAEECDLKPTGMTQVFHAGGQTDNANTYLVNIRLPNGVEICQLKVTEGKIAGPSDVLVGMDVIGHGDFAVTNKDGKTVFSFRVPSIQCIDFVKEFHQKNPVKRSLKVGRNDPCPCGSGKKYKHCCLRKD